MFKEFKQFALRGNVLDMAVGVMVGGAFGKIVTSLVNDILMPPMGLILGKVNFSNLFLNLSSRPVQSVEEARSAGIPTVNYGLFLNTLLDFLIVSFAIFLLVRQVNRLFPKPVSSTRQCPFCFSTIAVKATRCAHCTSHLDEKADGARA